MISDPFDRLNQYINDLEVLRQKKEPPKAEESIPQQVSEPSQEQPLAEKTDERDLIRKIFEFINTIKNDRSLSKTAREGLVQVKNSYTSGLKPGEKIDKGKIDNMIDSLRELTGVKSLSPNRVSVISDPLSPLPISQKPASSSSSSSLKNDQGDTDTTEDTDWPLWPPLDEASDKDAVDEASYKDAAADTAHMMRGFSSSSMLKRSDKESEGKRYP